jgi:RNA polymerase sigma-70 factor (ECF subfamily)
MSRLHRGRKLLRELLADYAHERGMGGTKDRKNAAATVGTQQENVK